MEVSGKLQIIEVPGKLQVRTGSEQCDPCLCDGKSQQADGFCSECEEYMCLTCFQAHQKYKLSKHHNLGPLSLGLVQQKHKDQDTEPCQKHPKEKLKYYCRHHDKAACGDCTVAEHTGCKMEFLKDVARKFDTSSEFNSMLEKISRLQGECIENRKKLDKNRTDNRALTEMALKEIRKLRKELNDYFDHAENEMINEARRMSKENDDLIAEVETKLSRVTLDVDDLSRMLDTKLYKHEKLFFRYLECKSRVNDAELSVRETFRKGQIKQFSFHPNELLKDLMMEKLELGTFKQSEKNIDKACQKENVLKNQYRGQATGELKLVQHRTPSYTDLLIEEHRDPDPRARGFDVGKQVRGQFPFIGETGTVTSVNPQGMVDVRWENGDSTLNISAGYRGFCFVELV